MMDTGNDGKIPTVMVVDDDWLNRELMDGILTAFGFRPVLAHDGETALDMVAAERPDAMLVDVRMPDMDGYTLCETIKAQDPTLPVMLVTAYEIEAGETQRAESVGADRILQRGGKMEDLIEAIRHLLSK